jgi:hypothetical protein
MGPSNYHIGLFLRQVAVKPAGRTGESPTISGVANGIGCDKVLCRRSSLVVEVDNLAQLVSAQIDLKNVGLAWHGSEFKFLISVSK